MALSLADKKQVVSEVAAVAQSAHSAVAAEYRGLTVEEMTALRVKAREGGVYLRVVKNTLARRAVEGTEFECLTDGLTGPLVFVFNFHPSQSYPDYRFGVPRPCDYRMVLNTDAPAFGGFGTVPAEQTYPVQKETFHGRKQSIQIYIPARTAQVLAPVE